MRKPQLNTAPGLREWIGRLLLIGWAVAASALIALLALNHSAALPRPKDALLTQAMLKLRQRSAGNFLVHVIYSECSCSRTLLKHLAMRRPFSGDEELILFVGSNSLQRESAKRAGFEFVTVSAAELVGRFGMEAAPVFVIFDSAGRLRYAAGYYDNPAAITPIDERIYQQFTRGSNVEPLPVFGCAVSPGLQKALDPLRVGP